jgi:hypothetical protein
MKKEIMHELSDYIAAYEKYKDFLENKSLISSLTKVYNELLTIAERNAHSYIDFKKECSEKNIINKFNKAVIKCRKEFNKHL